MGRPMQTVIIETVSFPISAVLLMPEMHAGHETQHCGLTASEKVVHEKQT